MNMSPESIEPSTVPGLSQQYDLLKQVAASAEVSTENEDLATVAMQALPACESLSDAALILMADNWKLFETLERLLKRKSLIGFITFLDLAAFLMKCRNDQKFAATWSEEEIKAVQMLRDNWKEKGRIQLQTFPVGRNRVLCLDKDALARLTDFSCDIVASENSLATPQADVEPMAFDSFRAAKTQDAANKVYAPLSVVPQKLLDAMTVHQGDGYWQVSERMLSLAGEKPSNHEVWNLMKALLTAHETSGVSAKGYLKVGELLPIDEAIQADAGFRRILEALQ
jgi:hypothetical protein